MVLGESEYELASSLSGFGFAGEDRRFHPGSSNFKISDISCAYILSHIENYNFRKHKVVQESLIKKVNEFGGKVLGEDDGVFYGNIPAMFNGPQPEWLLGYDFKKYYNPLSKLREANRLYDRIVNIPINLD